MNRPSAFCLVLAFAICFTASQPFSVSAAPQNSQPAPAPSGSNLSQNEPTERYSITISAYHLDDVDSTQLTTDNIVAIINAQNAKPFETIMLSAMAGTESRVSFGRSVTVTAGRTSTGDGSTRRNTQQRDLGTILHVTASPENGKVIATLSFKSSRHVGEGTDDSPPDTATTSVNTTQIFDLEQPALIAAKTTDETSYILLTISRR